MQRRNFCNFWPLQLRPRQFRILGKPNIAVHQLPLRFNQYTQDYAQFCALSPEKSVFYEVSNGRIIQSKLDNATWNPPEWGRPPDLPIPGGAWDGVPMDSPIADLAGEGPYEPHRIPCCNTKRMNGIRTQNSASGRIGVRNACPRPETSTPAICTLKDCTRTNTTWNITGRHRVSVTRSCAPSGRCSIGIPAS